MLWLLHIECKSVKLTFLVDYLAKLKIAIQSTWSEFVCPLPISIRKAQSGIKNHKTFAHLVYFSKMCLPCLIIIQSCFDYRINKLFICSRCVLCISFSVHLILVYYTHKGSCFFFILIGPLQDLVTWPAHH